MEGGGGGGGSSPPSRHVNECAGADFEASDEDMFDDRTVEISKCVMDLTAHARKRTEVDSENANMAGKYLDIHVGQSASAEDLKEKMVHQLNGTLLVPVHFNTLAQALASCPSGGKIALQADNYNLSLYRVIVPEAFHVSILSFKGKVERCSRAKISTRWELLVGSQGTFEAMALMHKPEMEEEVNFRVLGGPWKFVACSIRTVPDKQGSCVSIGVPVLAMGFSEVSLVYCEIGGNRDRLCSECVCGIDESVIEIVACSLRFARFSCLKLLDASVCDVSLSHFRDAGYAISLTSSCNVTAVNSSFSRLLFASFVTSDEQVHSSLQVRGCQFLGVDQVLDKEEREGWTLCSNTVDSLSSFASDCTSTNEWFEEQGCFDTATARQEDEAEAQASEHELERDPFGVLGNEGTDERGGGEADWEGGE